MRRDHILIVDDEEHVRKSLSMLLRSHNYQVSQASNAQQALKKITQAKIDLVLCDIYLPGLSGIEILEKIKAADGHIPVIMMTAYGSIESAVECMSKGAYNYISKPIKIETLTVLIEKALAERRLVEENIFLKKEVKAKYNFAHIIGCSKAIEEIIEIIKKVADKKSSVLISGESGTGKELIAKAIHFNSPRMGKPFVAVNCGAIPANLMETEFFGHKKGAFTGAFQDKKGLLEQASGGSIFFDEIGELSPNLQVKLLRAIQEEEIIPVGDTKRVKIDLRIIAATNKDLLEEVRKGNFREELYYRLCVVTIKIPPLRERREDIPSLINHFFNLYRKELGVKVKSISKEALKILLEYDYPGNVRELQNIVESSLILGGGEVLTPADLPANLQPHELDLIQQIISQEHSLKKAAQRVRLIVEKELIENMLQRTNHNFTKAARLLKISRATLYNKINAYQIKIPSGGTQKAV
jgi:DNA-binding NtrC family response regulator